MARIMGRVKNSHAGRRFEQVGSHSRVDASIDHETHEGHEKLVLFFDTSRYSPSLVRKVLGSESRSL